MDDPLTKHVQTKFSLYGLTITRKISKSLADYLLTLDEEVRNSTLTDIIDQILSQNLTTPNISVENVRIAIKECDRTGNTLKDEETILSVIDNSTIPKVTFNHYKKKFVLTKENLELLPTADHKPRLYSSRIDLIHKRTIRHELFQPPKLGEANPNQMQITNIEFLKSNTKRGTVRILGMLTLMADTGLYLEDNTAYIKLDVSKTEFGAGIMVIGTIVICDGEYDDSIMKVRFMCLPPWVHMEDVSPIFANSNTFGGPSKTSLKFSENLRNVELANEDGMIAFISDFWLDEVENLNKFKLILDGFADYPPIAIVICGQFLTVTINSTNISKLEDGFRTMADLIVEYPNILETTKFIFVPGSGDIGGFKIFPRGPMPQHCLKYFINKVPNTILAPNPCRIQICTKEIIVLRENLVSKFCRNTLHFPSDEKPIYEHFAETIVSQAHLAPFLLPVFPVFWKHGHILELFPTPHLLVVADKFRPYKTNVGNCRIINPGSFSESSFTFMTYNPAANEVDECAVTED